MSRRLQSLLVNGLLVLASGILVVVAAEGVLRAFPGLASEEVQLRLHWRAMQVMGDGGEAAAVVPDAEIGFLYRPHLEAAIGRDGFSFHFTTDRLGFRNPDLPEGEAGIVVVGDSMAFGYGVADEAGWVALLDRAMPDQRIVNLGLIGTGPPQYERIHARFGRPFRPRLVVLTLFSGNDLNDTFAFESWRGAGRPGTYSEWVQGGGAPAGAAAWAESLLTESYLAASLRAARRSLATRYQGHTHEFPDGRRLQLAPTVHLGNVARARPDSPDFQAAIRAILATRDMATADGADFLVVIVPTKEEVYLPLLGKAGPDLVAPFAAELAAQGVWQLDLTPALQARALEEPVYFEVDGHPNAAGYAIIAEAVLRAIRERDAEDGPSS